MEKDLLDEGDRELRHHPCPFERPLLSGRWQCTLAEKYLIALREGINCRDPAAQGQCQELCELMTQHSRFTLGQGAHAAPLTHGQLQKVRNGILQGLQDLAQERGEATPVSDIHELVSGAVTACGDVASVPVQPLLRAIAHSGRRGGA